MRPGFTDRAASPSNSELSSAVNTPSASPPPEEPKRQYGTPGTRADGHPKRPMNAFILYSNDMRSKLADQNPHLSNAAVSVLLGQRWRDMLPHEKAGYVSAAKRIKEDFHLQHPDAKTRCVSRKAKRAKLDGHARRSVNPPSLQALALVGSRLNQEIYPGDAPEYGRCDSASTYTQGEGGSSYDAPSRRSYDEEDDDDDDEPGFAEGGEPSYGAAEAAAPSSEAPERSELMVGPSLLEQLCTVVENEHTAAAEMLSALGTAH